MKIRGEKRVIRMPSREKQQNHFIIGAVIGGVAAYVCTQGNIASTIFVAVVVGIAAAIFWK